MENTITINGKVYFIKGKPEDMPATLFFRALHIAQAASAAEKDAAKGKEFYQGMFLEIMATARDLLYFALGPEQAEVLEQSVTVPEFRDAALEAMALFPSLAQ